jgi:N-acetylglutamate synthase-like GNAT family acetyltransferase
MSLDIGSDVPETTAHVRAMHAEDLDSADRVMRLAFGTIRGLPDPSAAFGDTDSVRTRFRASPECAWAAELDGEVVGSVFAARWGSFGFVGPLSVHPRLWDQGIGGLLLQRVLEAFERWGLGQAGLFTFAASPKHLGLYQKYGFWPGSLTVVMTKATGAQARSPFTLVSKETENGRGRVLDEICRLTDQVFRGLDLGREIVAAHEQGIGDTVLLRRDGTLEGMAVCQCGAGSEAGSDTCYVKFAAVRPGEGASGRFEELLDACEVFATESELGRLVAGVSTARLDAYRRLLARGYRTERVGVSMWLRPEEPHFDTPAHYVIDDLR